MMMIVQHIPSSFVLEHSVSNKYFILNTGDSISIVF